MRTKGTVVPVLIIVLGVTWLLNVLQVLPAVDWVWTAGLAAVGILTLLVGGINRLTVVVGPFLLVGSICSLLRQLGSLSVDREVPILITFLGIFMLVAQVLGLSLPEFLKPEDAPDKQ